MNYNVFFSPTGGTEKMVRYIGTQFGNKEDIDISLENSDCIMDKEDFCIVGVPSFGGRAPEIAVKRLQQLKGNQTPALIIVTYGNRAYEDTLKELEDVMEMQGFVCIGAAAIVTEHSIMHQFGMGRPNEEDYIEIDKFVTEIKKRLSSEYKKIKLPGNTPYKELKIASMQPQVSDNCEKCGLCARKCPAGAISIENPQQLDSDKCISCMRCVSICPYKARKCDEEKLEKMIERLKGVCSEYKQNEFY